MLSFSPVNYMILPTMACQASCKYCFSKKTGRLMSLDTACKTIDTIYRMADRKKDILITFHGGEPLLAGHDWYEVVLDQIRSRFGRRCHIQLQSNLWEIDEKFLDLIEKYQISVGTSIDGFPSMCDEQRGEGYYERTKASQKKLADRGIVSGGIATFTPKWSNETKKVFENSIYPYSIHGAVKPIDHEDNDSFVNVEDLTSILLDSYEAYKLDPSHSRIATIDAMVKGVFEEDGVSCMYSNCLGKFIAISPEGDIYSCQRLCGYERFKLGNVNQSPTAKDILSSEGYKLLKDKEDEMTSSCKDCHHFKYCKGGCLYNAISYDTKCDPFCEAYKKTFERINIDLSMELGKLMLGMDSDNTLLSMAGKAVHPYDLRMNREKILWALEKGSKIGKLKADTHFPENHLNKLYLHLTFDCPLRCKHCYADGGVRKTAVMDDENIFKIISDASDRMFKSVVITGGEPLYYPYFDKLLDRLSDFDRKGTKLILRSSFGFEISDELLDRILSIFDEIVVSVDGSKETHDKQRGKGTYDKTIANLERVYEKGYSSKMGLCCTLDASDLEGFPGKCVDELADRLEIKKVRLNKILPLGRAGDIDTDPCNMCLDEIDPDGKYSIRTSCGIGENLYVEPDGKSYPCYSWCSPDKLLGDLSKMTLKELLDKKELYSYQYETVDTNKKCLSCEVRYLCGGICKAYLKNRSDLNSDDFDCKRRKDYFLKVAETIKNRGM